MNGIVRKPNFLYIGPNKAGSTWIYENLRLHPQVFLSRAKELHYFDLYYSLGPRWYFRHFRDAKPHHRVVGEVSHDYLYSEEACARIATDLGNVRLMVCLREPVDRAFSEYLYMIRQGYLRMAFPDAIKQYPRILEHSIYAKNLARYAESFGSAALLITVFDDLKCDPIEYYRELCRMLGVAEIVPKGVSDEKALPAAAPRSFIVARAAKECAMIMRKLGFAELITRVKSQRWIHRALYRQYGSDKVPRLEANIRDRLKAFFLDDVRMLDRHFVPGIAQRWRYE